MLFRSLASGSKGRYSINVTVKGFVASLHACIQPGGESEHYALVDSNHLWKLRLQGNLGWYLLIIDFGEPHR